MRPTLLALDAGGVLVFDSMRTMFAKLEQHAQLEPGTLYPWYRQHLRDALWSGAGTEREFFERLLEHVDVDADIDDWRQVLIGIMRPLPGLARISDWAEKVDLAILSNYRHEWLRPLLDEAGVLPLFAPERLFISSETGQIKPDADAFALLTALRNDPAEILYVDDQQANIDAARESGLDAIRADADGRWIAAVDERLSR